MIRFALLCEAEHRFEVWFRDNADFDAQRAEGLVECPCCGSRAVGKALMTPQVASRGEREKAPDAAPEVPAFVELRRRMAEFARHVRANTTDVGGRFPEEARRIHHGEVEPRLIRGTASPSQARALRDEGVAIAPLPSLPEDAN